MLEIKECPICGAQGIRKLFTCKDYTVSQETFWLATCIQCGFKMTNPRPETIELEKYYQSNQYISHSGKAYNIIDQIYLFARGFTLKKKLKLIEKYRSHGLMLDYGCGTGEFLSACKTAGWYINGIEPSANARTKSAELTQSKIYKSIEEVDNIYDVITLWHVLEHVPNLNTVLRKLSDLLDKNGTLIIAVPNYESYDAQYYKEFWAAYDVPRHLWHFDKSIMEKLLAKHSLFIKEIKPMKLDSFYVSMLSEKYKNAKSITGLIKAFFNGVISNIKASRTGNYSSLIYIVQK